MYVDIAFFVAYFCALVLCIPSLSLLHKPPVYGPHASCIKRAIVGSRATMQAGTKRKLPGNATPSSTEGNASKRLKLLVRVEAVTGFSASQIRSAYTIRGAERWSIQHVGEVVLVGVARRARV